MSSAGKLFSTHIALTHLAAAIIVYRKINIIYRYILNLAGGDSVDDIRHFQSDSVFLCCAGKNSEQGLIRTVAGLHTSPGWSA